MAVPGYSWPSQTQPQYSQYSWPGAGFRPPARSRLLDRLFPTQDGGGGASWDDEDPWSGDSGGGAAWGRAIAPRNTAPNPTAGGGGMPMFPRMRGWTLPPPDPMYTSLLGGAMRQVQNLPGTMAEAYDKMNAQTQQNAAVFSRDKYHNANWEQDKYKFDKMLGAMTPAIQSLAGVPSATADFQSGVGAKLARAPAMSAASNVYEKLLGALGIPATSAPTPITGFTGEGGMFANPSGVGTGIDTNAAAGIPGIVAEGLRGMRGVANQTMPYLRGPNTGYADYFKNVAMGVPVGKAAQLGRAGAKTATGLSLAAKGLNSAKMNELLDLLRLMYSGGLQSQSDLSDFGLRSLGGIQQSMMG